MFLVETLLDELVHDCRRTFALTETLVRWDGMTCCNRAFIWASDRADMGRWFSAEWAMKVTDGRAHVTCLICAVFQ